MEFEGVYYSNLDYRSDRNDFMIESLGNQGFPSDKIFRVEGVDASEFASVEEAISELSEIYPEINTSLSRPDPSGFPGKGDICCMAVRKRVFTRIYEDLTDSGIALCVHDDVLVKKDFSFFENLVVDFDGRVDIVQLFSWTSWKGCPSLMKIPSSINDKFYTGVVFPGDKALLLSKRGCRNILDVYREHTNQFTETLFYFQPQRFHNFYTVTDSFEWVEVGDERESDRLIANAA